MLIHIPWSFSKLELVKYTIQKYNRTNIFSIHFSPNISILILRLALIFRQTKFLWSLTYQARPLLVFAFKKAGLSDFCKFSPVSSYKSSLPVTTTSKNHPSTLGKK